MYLFQKATIIFSTSSLLFREHFHAGSVQICLPREYEDRDKAMDLLVAEMQQHSTLPNANWPACISDLGPHHKL